MSAKRAATRPSDIQIRFARVHLSTRPERVVYLSLVSERERAWTAAEIAERHHARQDEIQSALRCFQEVGIAEATGLGGEPRYRWGAAMNYLFGEPRELSPWVDPVCGMLVREDSPYDAKDMYGRPRRFCSPLCHAAFLAFPSTWSEPPAEPIAEGG